MAPLSEVWRVRLSNAIRIDAARTGGAGQGLRTILISTQIAMSVILVVGALLLVRTFVNVQAIDPGFNAGGIYSFRLASRPAKDRGLAFGRQLQAELSALTGRGWRSVTQSRALRPRSQLGRPLPFAKGRRPVDGSASGLPIALAWSVGADRYSVDRWPRFHRRR